MTGLRGRCVEFQCPFGVALRAYAGHLHLRQSEEGVGEALLGGLDEEVVSRLRVGGVQSNSPVAELRGIRHATSMSQRTI